MKKDKVLLLFLYLYGFYIFYFPELNSFIGIQSHLILAGLFMILFPFVIFMNRSKPLIINKNLFLLILGIVISVVYFAIRATIANEEIRILQNSFIILQILHVALLCVFLNAYGLTKEEKIRFPLNLAVIQSFICIAMIFYPPLKEIALSLYYNGRAENIFISANRIYGISNDYTFFTPSYHGILCVVSFIFAILKNWRYILYIPFLLITILLNGRIGLIVFIVGATIAVFYILLKGKSKIKVLSYMTLIIFFVLVTLNTAKYIVPNTYNWIISGLNDSINFLAERELNGNYLTLFDQMLFLPPNLMFGEGLRVYSGNAMSYGFGSSDIGYVNDLFMGGLIYILILYFTIYYFILKVDKQMLANNYLLSKVVSYSLFFMLVVANFKGESMRSGLILLIIVYIKLVISSDRKINTE